MIHLDRQAGESQAEFCERCHKELESSIPETDRRNTVCLQMCRDAGFDGPQRFSEQEFQSVRDVPVFAEHTTKDRAGNLVVYDRNALQSIADRCNSRIQDTGDFPPITEGHTPTKEEMAQGAKMPDVLGYAANFRLGRIGNTNPRWAIFCDEYHHREDAQKLRKLRRRSPEVWLEDRMEDRFFDPIAALGAETPRLDMGMARYRLTTDGREVEKYSRECEETEHYTAAAAPSAASAFIPKDEYESEGESMISPDDVNQIIEALMATKEMQFLQQQMATQAPPDAGGMPGEGMPGAEPAGSLPGMPPAADAGMPPAATPAPATPAPAAAPPAAPPAKPPFEPDDEDKANFSRYMAGDMGDEEMAAYRAGKRQKMAAYSCGDKPMPEADAYSRSNEDRQTERIEKARYEKLEAEVKDLREKAEKAESDKRQAERYSKLSELRQEGYSLDPQKELARTAKFDDEAFEAHLDCITENYSRLPIGQPSLYTPDLQTPAQKADDAKKEKYSRRAIEIATAAANSGKHLSSTEAFEQAVKEINAA